MLRKLTLGRFLLILSVLAVIAMGAAGCGNKATPAPETRRRALTTTITGIVRQEGTRAPLADVKVSSGTRSTLTSTSGKYSLGGLARVRQTISYAKPGFTGYTRSITLSRATVSLVTVLLTPVAAPSPTPVPTPLPAPGGTLTADEQQLFNLVNADRVKGGLQALVSDPVLVSIARSHSQDMIDHNFFDHTSPTTGSPFDRMKAAGVTYGYAGENIAGYPTVAQAHAGLMASAGHRANIMSPNLTRVGIGIRPGGTYGLYITEDFTGPYSSAASGATRRLRKVTFSLPKPIGKRKR